MRFQRDLVHSSRSAYRRLTRANFSKPPENPQLAAPDLEYFVFPLRLQSERFSPPPFICNTITTFIRTASIGIMINNRISDTSSHPPEDMRAGRNNRKQGLQIAHTRSIDCFSFCARTYVSSTGTRIADGLGGVDCTMTR